jgi:hypothetical protein
LHARAPGGFAERISAWNEVCATAPMPLFVEDPAITLARLRGESVATSSLVPVAEALDTLRQLIARGTSAERATRANVASIAG